MILWGLGGRFLQAFCNSRYLLNKYAMDGGAADEVVLRQLSQAMALLAITEDGGSIEDQSLPSDMTSFELGPPHAGAHSLDDQAALQLSDGADDDHHRPAGRPAGIDLLLEADELDVQPDKLVQNLQEVLR